MLKLVPHFLNFLLIVRSIQVTFSTSVLSSKRNLCQERSEALDRKMYW